jgi:hypothetical protein
MGVEPTHSQGLSLFPLPVGVQRQMFFVCVTLEGLEPSRFIQAPNRRWFHVYQFHHRVVKKLSCFFKRRVGYRNTFGFVLV